MCCPHSCCAIGSFSNARKFCCSVLFKKKKKENSLQELVSRYSVSLDR